MTEDERELINRSDVEKINATADYFNSEMEDVRLSQAEFDDSLFAETLDPNHKQ